jgi:hypothetical protein
MTQYNFGQNMITKILRNFCSPWHRRPLKKLNIRSLLVSVMTSAMRQAGSYTHSGRHLLPQKPKTQYKRSVSYL